MEDGLGHGSWKKSTLSMNWNEQHPDHIVFWHRDLIACTKWILRQPAYEKHLVYAPVRSFNAAGNRIYDEMHTGDWWWSTQVGHHSSCGLGLATADGSSSVQLASWRDDSANNIYVRCNPPHQLLWRQKSMAGIYDDWEPICEGMHEAYDAWGVISCSFANSSQDARGSG
jgi:hypothetical protein